MNRPSARLLVVDDNDAGRYLKTRILQKEGWTVDQAADGQTTLRRIEAELVDLIVLDVKLPDILGTEVCKRIKQKNPGILILQTSATFVDPEHRVKGLDSGADAYLTEPVEATEFIATIRALLRAKDAEEKLRAADARMAALVRSCPDAIIGYSPDGRIESWNRGAEKMFGYSAFEAIGREADLVVPPEAPEGRRGFFDRAIRGETITEETTRLRKDGARVAVLLSVSPIRMADQIIGVSAFMRDISDRKHAEQALRMSEERLRRVQQIGRIGSLTYRPGSSEFAIYSAEYLALHGLPPDHPGETREQWLARVHPEDRDKADRDLSDALAGRVPRYESEFRVVWPDDGSLHWIMARGEVERDAVSGAPLRMTVTQYDVTAQRRAEAALRDSEQTARLAFEELNSIYLHAPVGLCVLSTDLRYIRINERLAEINGIPSQAHIGRTVHEIIPTLADQISAIVETIMRTGEPVLNVDFEGETPAQPGIKRSWLEHWSPHKDGSGTITAINVVAEEITERKQHEEHLHVIMRELAHRSKNLLAVVQSMVRQTAQHAEGMEAFIDQLDSRIGALSHAHDLLIEQNWQGAALIDLVTRQLEPFVSLQNGRVTVTGPPLMIGAQATQNLALALHELATNSCKYGALSAPGGTVAIGWEFKSGGDGGKSFRLTWTENGGPTVKRPERRGFGTLVLERLVAAGLNGRAELDYARDGLNWTLMSDEASFCREGIG